MKSYADILRELREDRDLTQSQVARVLGTTQQVYSRYERGSTRCRCTICGRCAFTIISARIMYWVCPKRAGGPGKERMKRKHLENVNVSLVKLEKVEYNILESA